MTEAAADALRAVRRSLRAPSGRGVPLAVVLTLAAVLAGCEATQPKALSPIGEGIRGPRGLVASVYARGLLHVSALAFDTRGRLWATTSGASNDAGDGVYVIARRGARPSKIVSGLEAPLGLVWAGRQLIVASLGRVTAFGGFDGVAFRTGRVILTGPVATGENNNIIRRPDGRLVLGVSASCDHCVPTVKWSGAVVSFRPDGSDLRLVARGIRAPFGLSYDQRARLLYASMNQRDDLGAKTPGDWLAIVRQGQDWGFPGCYGQHATACAGKPSPVAVLDVHAAAGGVALVSGELGAALRSSALVAEWQYGSVKRVGLSGTSRGVTTTFLTGFVHPLAVLTAPDGSVLVGDWGRGIVYRIAT